jgi:hypothetical protein
MCAYIQCHQVCELCDALVQTSKDSLIIQPTHLELVTIRKKPDDEVVSLAVIRIFGTCNSAARFVWISLKCQFLSRLCVCRV